MSDAVYALILAGGAGTRFWPASRRARPKQLLALAGDDVLLGQTIARIASSCRQENVLIATGAHLVEPTLAAVPGLARAQLLVEPAPRNTAPCIGWAAHTVARTDPNAVIIALPSDHHIADIASFRAALALAIDSARSGVITTIGIRPAHPETGFGYIEAAASGGAVWRALRFVEKPTRARAEEFVAAGSFFWNAGMFFFRAGDMVAAIRAHLPELATGLDALDAAAARGNEESALAEIFPALPAVSIDVGVMEKLDRLAMVPGDFGWSDVGNWLAVADLAAKDARGNASPPGAIFIDADDNFVTDARTSRGKRVIALCGVRDLVVVETDDALLIVHRSEAQRVREIVDALTQRGDRELT